MPLPNWLNTTIENIRKTRKAYPEVYIFLTAVVMQHSNIDISLDKKQLDSKKIEF